MHASSSRRILPDFPFATLLAGERLRAAERRFFAAYERGGTHAPADLVMPADYFARPRVRAHLEEWCSGRAPLEQSVLAAEWACTDGHRGRERFEANLEHFLDLVQRRGR